MMLHVCIHAWACACVRTCVCECVKRKISIVFQDNTISLLSAHLIYALEFIFLGMWDYFSSFKCACDVATRGSSDAPAED